jgi:hypothetical protein
MTVSFDVGPGVEKPPQHAVRVSILQASIATLRTARHKRDEFVHGTEAGQPFLVPVPVTRLVDRSESQDCRHVASLLMGIESTAA